MIHKMDLVRASNNGDEYLCPICGRRITIDWHKPGRAVIEPGDESAQHVGGVGGIELQVDAVDPYLDVFEDYLRRGND